MRRRPAARYACNGAQRKARGRGALQPEPPDRPGTPTAALLAPQLPLQSHGSAPWCLACSGRWPYLRVREIVEEEGRELFIQQRAAVVPRHLPAAAAACGGVSAEPARGRERARRREEAARRAGGGRSSGPRLRQAGWLRGRGRVSLGSYPHFPCSESVAATRSRSPPQG